MRRFGSVRVWLAAGVLSSLSLASANGCGGSAATISGPYGDDAGDATADGASGGSSGGPGDASNPIDALSEVAASSSSGSDSGRDSSGSSSSSSGGGDSGADSGSSSSGSSGGADSSADSNADSSGTSTSSSGGGDSGADSRADSGADSGGSSSSSGGGDSGSDATFEAGPPCAPNGSACALGSISGICIGGACFACTAEGATGPSPGCSAAYGDTGSSGYLCIASGSCVPGDCTSDTDCSGGICGLTRAKFCGGCTTDTQCHADAHYGAATICNTTSHTCVSSSCATAGTVCANPADICCGAGPACTPGNCCSNAQCSATVATPACNPATDRCIACDAVGASATAVLVDPLNGIDVATNGSGTAAGQPNGACAFRTIGYALTQLGASTTTVNVLPTGPVSVAGNGETFPIDVSESNIAITGSTGTPLVNDVGTDSTTGVAFALTGDGASLSNLIIDGAVTSAGGATPTATHGIVVGSGSTLATAISNVVVRNFTRAGIRVGDSGIVSIGPGTNVHDNGSAGTTGASGLYVSGSGMAVVTGNAAGAAIAFNANAENGILVDNGGSVTITGDGAGGSVQAEQNGIDGLEIRQSIASPPNNTITGFLAVNNVHDGARLYAASAATIRGSIFLGNTDNGIQVLPITTAATAAGNNDISSIDLGTGAGAGENDLQDTAAPNGGAGVCVSLAQGQGQVLAAEGNKWVSSGGAAADVDCSTTAATLSEGASGTVNSGRACLGGVDIGGAGLGGSTAMNGVDVTMCTCAAGTTCQ
jgi:hypothetical protein